jgi:hypothetical protein
MKKLEVTGHKHRPIEPHDLWLQVEISSDCKQEQCLKVCSVYKNIFSSCINSLPYKQSSIQY